MGFVLQIKYIVAFSLHSCAEPTTSFTISYSSLRNHKHQRKDLMLRCPAAVQLGNLKLIKHQCAQYCTNQKKHK